MFSILAKTTIEFLVVVLLIYGFVHEQEIIKIEQKIKIKILRALLQIVK